MATTFAGVQGAGSTPTTEPMSQYKDLAGNYISQAQADRQANYASGGSLYQQSLDEEKAMRDRVAAMRANAPAGVGVVGIDGNAFYGAVPSTGGPDPNQLTHGGTPMPLPGGFAGVQTGGPDPFPGVQNGGANGKYSNSGASALSVDPKTMTVASQLSSVLAADSPLIQQARTRAMQTMNARGLSNSSMAIGAADAAMYDTALEIAKPDSATYYDAGKTNVGYDNQFKMADKTQGFDLAKINAQGEQTRLTAKYVADTEAKYKSLTQGSAAATSLLTKMQDSINAVWANDKITDKQKVIDDIRINTENALRIVGSLAGDVDLAAFVRSVGGE